MKKILMGIGTSAALIGSYYTYQKYCYEKIVTIDKNTQTEPPIKKIDDKIVKEIVNEMIDDIEYNLTKKRSVSFNTDFEIIDH